jgi:hypothetical protein
MTARTVCRESFGLFSSVRANRSRVRVNLLQGRVPLTPTEARVVEVRWPRFGRRWSTARLVYAWPRRVSVVRPRQR